MVVDGHDPSDEKEAKARREKTAGQCLPARAVMPGQELRTNRGARDGGELLL